MVHGNSLEGNLEGNSADREVMVVLPPSYGKEPGRHYPVVYYLHGFAIDGRNFYNFMHVPEAVAANAAAGREFIVVVPDTMTKMGGSMYSDSVTTGNFREFVAKDLVAYIDANYRTIPTREGRGLAGHSMGGYGTWVTAMSYPGVFDCDLGAERLLRLAAQRDGRERDQDGRSADRRRRPFGLRHARRACRRWSPGRPIRRTRRSTPTSRWARTARSIRLVIAKWANNSPLAMVPSHIDALRSYDAIGSDVGTKDGLIRDDTMISEELDRFGIAHTFLTYEGTHVDHIAERFKDVVLPFFAKHLQMK